MAASQAEILEAISNMSVMEVVDLISAMEEKFGVSAAAAVAEPAGAPASDASADSSYALVDRDGNRISDGLDAMLESADPSERFDVIATFEDDAGAYNQKDAEGFIKLNALRMRIAANKGRSQL